MKSLIIWETVLSWIVWINWQGQTSLSYLTHEEKNDDNDNNIQATRHPGHLYWQQMHCIVFITWLLTFVSQPCKKLWAHQKAYCSSPWRFWAHCTQEPRLFGSSALYWCGTELGTLLAWSHGCFPQSGSLCTHYSRSTVHAQPPKEVKQFYEDLIVWVCINLKPLADTGSIIK